MERLNQINKHFMSSESAFVSALPEGWDWDPKNSKLNIEYAREFLLKKQQRLIPIVQKILASDRIFETQISREINREEKRNVINKQLVVFMNKLYDGQHITPEWVCRNIDEFAISVFNVGSLQIAAYIKLAVHFNLYMKSIMLLGTKKHYDYALKAAKFQDWGCFALTELAHGSNVQGIGTTATYDPSTKQFILNTPNQQDMKFWIGNLGKSAHMAVVFAQLITLGKNHGVHVFLVPLRDRKTHEPLPGLTIGDCGAKVGMHAIDNGFMLMHNYKVSRDALLDKLGQVDEEGNYTSEIQSKSKRFGLTVAAISGGRVAMAVGALSQSLSPLCIAIRFAFLRRQFAQKSMKADEPESVLIDYQLHQCRLIPRLARTMTLKFALEDFFAAFNLNNPNLLVAGNKKTEENHAFSTFFKYYAGTIAQQDIIESRQAMGGLGYSAYSRMNEFMEENDINLTWEGDNKVILQQTSKFILKNIQKINGGEPANAFFENLKPIFEGKAAKATQDYENLDNIVNLIERSFVLLAYKSGSALQNYISDQGMYEGFTSSVPLQINPLTVAFGEVYTVKAARQRLSTCQDQPTKEVLSTLVRVGALYMMQQRMSEFMGADMIPEDDLETFKASFLTQVKSLRNEILPLTTMIDNDLDLLEIPFSHQDAYARFIGKVMRSGKTMERIEGYENYLP